MNDFLSAFKLISNLVKDFKENEKHYIDSSYSEADVRNDFINKFFIALGWDVRHEVQKNPYEQEVRVEKPVTVAKAQKRADYTFYLAPNFRDVKFFVEAKKPAHQLENKDYYFQTIRYGWNAGTPIAVLTDFEEFHIIDCRFKPNINEALTNKVKKFHYTEYADEEKFSEIYWLFSREAVENNSIKKFAESLPKPKGKKTQALKPTAQSIDESFLEELDDIRTRLAKSFKKNNANLSSEELTEAVQRTIDRLVFIKFLEDKLIEANDYISEFVRPHPTPLSLARRGAEGDVNIKTISTWEKFLRVCRTLDAKYNGAVFKKSLLDSRNIIEPDDKIFSEICEELSHENTPYNFDVIPVHILGSIYERFLGKVVNATEKRVTIEEKPEVRKAGGVYYTPQYIVNYIVDNTVGKLIGGKTPKEISKMRFADIACGSGSFLITVFERLLDYHKKWYINNPEQAKKDGCILLDGTYRLTLKQKTNILLNNIFGVDIDQQAVEVTQLSLYLKLLEDETTATANDTWVMFKEQILPDLNKNIVCGNSLISSDILNPSFGIPFCKGEDLGGVDELKLKPMDFESVFPEVMKNGGFDAIVGNPPYVDVHRLKEEADYYKKKYQTAIAQYNLFALFIEKGTNLLKESGLISYIIPSLFIKGVQHKPLRDLINQKAIEFLIIEYGDGVFKNVKMPTCVVIFQKGQKKEQLDFFKNKLNDFFSKIKTIKLQDITIIRRGIEIGKDKFDNEGEIKCISGSDIDKYVIKSVNLISKTTFKLFEKPKEVFESPKILVRETGDKFYSTIDYDSIITTRSIYNVKIINSLYEQELVLGIINSKLFQFYFKSMISPNTNIFPKIRVIQLKQIPLPLINNDNKNRLELRNIKNLVSQMLTTKKQLYQVKTESDRNYLQRKCDILDKQIDELVYQLYGLTEEEIKIIEKT